MKRMITISKTRSKTSNVLSKITSIITRISNSKVICCKRSPASGKRRRGCFSAISNSVSSTRPELSQLCRRHSAKIQSAFAQPDTAFKTATVELEAVYSRPSPPGNKTVIKRFARRLSQNGKTPMQIIGAAMRKLLHIAFGVIKNNRPFDPNPVNPVSTFDC